MRLAAGIPPTIPLTVSAVPHARKHIALDLVYGRINSISTPPSILHIQTQRSKSLFPSVAHPGPKWDKNLCWFDSALHILLYVYRWDPSIWSTTNTNTLLYHLSENFAKYWKSIDNFSRIDEETTAKVKWLEASAATTNWRNDMVAFLRQYPTSANSIETSKSGAFGLPFVSSPLVREE